MTAKAIKSPYAKLDLDEQAEYIAADNLDAAHRFLDAVERDCDFLARMPRAGVLRHFHRKELADVRSWPVGGFKNYLIMYRPTRDGIEVLRVLHGARDIGAIMDPP